MPLVVLGDSGGSVTITAPASGASNTITMPASSGTFALLSDIPSAVPAGAVSYFAASSAPTNWLKANGAAISRTTYSALFAAIGTTYGVGDNSTTFNIPDLRGEFLRSWDDSRGIDIGRVIGSAQAPTYLASLNDQSEVNVITNPDSVVARANISGGGGQAGTSRAATIQSFRPRNIALLACIKY